MLFPMTQEPSIAPRRDKVLWMLLGVCALLALIYNFSIALGYGPDEPRHMSYVRLLWDEHRFPFILPNGKEYEGAHSLHPPLYYAVLSPLFALTRPLFGESGWHIVRLLSAALCLSSLWLLFQVARTQGSRFVALLATAQVGLLPIWGMTAGAINNDGASLFAQSVLLWLLAVRFPRDQSTRSALILGVVLGLGALCKATNIVCGAASFGLYLVLQAGGLGAALRSAQVWKRLGSATLVALLVCGAWYGRSFHLYGSLTPIENGYTHPALGAAPRFGALTVALHPAFFPLLALALWGIFYSMWSQKDWLPEVVRLPIYLAFVGYCLAASVGNVRHFFNHRRALSTDKAVLDEAGQSPDDEKWVSGEENLVFDEAAQVAGHQTFARGGEFASGADKHDELAARIALRCGLAAFIVNVAACAAIAVFKHWGWAEGGRYLVPSLGGASLWAACGWRSLLGERGLKSVFWVWCALLLLLNAVALYWLLAFLNPTYVK